MHLRYFSWLHFFYNYDSSHLLIADAFFVRAIQSAKREKMNYKTATPETYESVVSEETRKILVFCSKNEVPLIRKLQAQYPDKTITSGTYHYSCTGPKRHPSFKQFTSAQKSKDARPVFMISTPYADAEFIARVMDANNLPMPYEFLSRATGTWLNYQKDFQISRFYNRVETAATKDDQSLYALLQTDVLSSLFENTHFSFNHFIKFLKSKNAKVILVNRKDHFAQAVMGSVMHATPERSVWTKKSAQKIQAKINAGTVAGTLSRQQQIPDHEVILDKIAASGLDHMKLHTEDFIEDQEGKTKEIAAFIDKSVPSKLAIKDYENGLKEINGLSVDGDAVRRYMIDSLGL